MKTKKQITQRQNEMETQPTQSVQDVPMSCINNAVKSPDMNWKIGCRPSRTLVEEVLTCPVFRLSA